jgi:hypothetical protein
MEVKMKNPSRLPNESLLQEDLEDESTIDEREEEDEEEEDEEEIYRKAIRAIEIHEGNPDLLYSGAEMYWLGMSIGWKAFRVLHTRRSSSTITVRGIRKHYLYRHSPTFSPRDFLPASIKDLRANVEKPAPEKAA